MCFEPPTKRARTPETAPMVPSQPIIPIPIRPREDVALKARIQALESGLVRMHRENEALGTQVTRLRAMLNLSSSSTLRPSS